MGHRQQKVDEVSRTGYWCGLVGKILSLRQLAYACAVEAVIFRPAKAEGNRENALRGTSAWHRTDAPISAVRFNGLACAGIGYGIVMPGVIKAVIGNVDERHAGLASGIVMTTLQIGSALGVAIVGGVFYTVLKTQTDIHSHARAFSDAAAINVALLTLGGILSLLLPNEQRVAGKP
jgi:cytochrome bd-type quinol oxidase subunit 2